MRPGISAHTAGITELCRNHGFGIVKSLVLRCARVIMIPRPVILITVNRDLPGDPRPQKRVTGFGQDLVSVAGPRLLDHVVDRTGISGLGHETLHAA